MGTCAFCYYETHPGERGEHPACRDEFDRRKSTSQCLICGELPMAPGTAMCHDCRETVVGASLPQFRNYPGGV